MPATGPTAPPSLFWLSLDAQLAAFQAALPGGRGEAYLSQRGIPLTLAQLAAGIPRVVAIYRVQGWGWAWAREIRTLVFALDAAAAGQPP